jgi:bis(5'-nucleosyl)-tetraphosphatase (symmetrical)
MAIYAVGDIQGCYDPLCRLLDQVKFDQTQDVLWCVGDLVNRGPQSLEVLRLLLSLNNQCVSVLGNHDIHLLSMIYGVRSPRQNDTLTDVLSAPDLDLIASWLRSKPLLFHNKETKSLLCHAGIYPWWDIQKSLALADEVSSIFSVEKKCIKLLKKIYSNSPGRWSDDLVGTPRLRFIINAFTRMRFVSPKGNLNLTESGYDGKYRKNRVPWVDVPNPGLSDHRVVFGHWSALGLHNQKSYLGLDTGCVWGKNMTMVKIPIKPNNTPIQQKHLFVAPF